MGGAILSGALERGGMRYVVFFHNGTVLEI